MAVILLITVEHVGDTEADIWVLGVSIVMICALYLYLIFRREQ
jgi:hypothetical protein